MANRGYGGGRFGPEAKQPTHYGAGFRWWPEEFLSHSKRIGGAMRLAAMGASTLVIQREGRWSSDAFIVCVRANKELDRDRGMGVVDRSLSLGGL